jgi:hypothetical protein
MQIPVLIARVAEDVRRADDILLSELREGIGDVSRWPTDQNMVDFYQQNDAYYNIQVARLVMALKAVERSLYSNTTDVLGLPAYLTIEHVIPQKWQQYWPLPVSDTPEEEEAALDKRRRSIHRLGNLTLTAGPLNSEMSNSEWSVKQTKLNGKSKLFLNTRIIEAYPVVFDEAAVAERTNFLVERICQIWPGPEQDWAEVG